MVREIEREREREREIERNSLRNLEKNGEGEREIMKEMVWEMRVWDLREVWENGRRLGHVGKGKTREIEEEGGSDCFNIRLFLAATYDKQCFR